MKYIAKIAIVLFTFWLAIPTIAQTPKKEVRAFWLSTVWRLTWPKTTVISNTGNAQEIQEQKDELIMLLDSVKAANANTVYFQVRGRCDAMYKSSYEPWSSDLVATRGMDPGYDPCCLLSKRLTNGVSKFTHGSTPTGMKAYCTNGTERLKIIGNLTRNGS